MKVERITIERPADGRVGWDITVFGDDGKSEAQYVPTAYGALGFLERQLTPWRGSRGGRARGAQQSAAPTHPMVRT